MNVRLTFQQKEMLIKVKDHFNWDKDLYFSDQAKNTFLEILEDDDATDLRELCSNYLIEIGFDKNYVVNKEGAILEELIDKLYID
jgi:hypothetical protein